MITLAAQLRCIDYANRPLFEIPRKNCRRSGTTPLADPGGTAAALAVTAAKRSTALPDVPSMVEAGFKGQDADTLQGVLLPAGAPKAIVTKLHAGIARALSLL